MNVRFFRLTTWVAVGHAVAAALFWAFLSVPESSVAMLALSALTLAACALVAGLTDTTAIRAAAGEVGWRAALLHGLRRWPAFLVGLALFLAAWWLTGRVFGWHQAHRGEIDAWLLLHFRWSRTAWLHTGFTGVLTLARWPLGALVALGATTAVVLNGWRDLAGLRWIRAALGWRPLAAALAAFLACFWGPWQVVYWRPGSLPSTWIEPAFAGAKILVLYAWAHVGWAWLLRTLSVRLFRPPAA